MDRCMVPLSLMSRRIALVFMITLIIILDILFDKLTLNLVTCDCRAQQGLTPAAIFGAYLVLSRHFAFSLFTCYLDSIVSAALRIGESAQSAKLCSKCRLNANRVHVLLYGQQEVSKWTKALQISKELKELRRVGL